MAKLKDDAKAASKPILPPTSAIAAAGIEPFPDLEEPKKDNPFAERDWRLFTYAWSGFALRIMLVVGALFSVVQYMEAKQDKRQERTLALVDQWEQSQYQDAQKALRDRLADLNTKYQSLLGAQPSQKELDVYYRRIGEEMMTPAGGAMPLAEFRDHFNRILYFLNRTASCASSKLCAPEMVDEYFRDYAKTFWGYFAGYIQQQRKAGTPNFAQPLETYLKSAVAAP